MQALPNFPVTLIEAVRFFADTEIALAFMVSMRWSDGVVKCPRCTSEKVGFLSTRKLWKCKGCAKQFSVKVGTIFEDSPLGLDKWLPAVLVIVNSKNGTSSCELARSIGVTQKTAWFMLHRIRLAMQSGGLVKSQLTGTVEVDESYIGGRGRFMHQKTKEHRGIKGCGMAGKTAVMGLLQHGDKETVSKIIADVLPSTFERELLGRIRRHVAPDAEIQTDALTHYNDVSKEYAHKIVDHAVCYVKDGVHTNGLEHFWSLLKRSIKGTYVSVEPFHLFRYLGEQVFRFNERKNTSGDQGRFLVAKAGVFGKRVTYRKLIGADMMGGLPC